LSKILLYVDKLSKEKPQDRRRFKERKNSDIIDDFN